jgi:Domain of unknown function (DUF5122) beta-propeller
MSTRRLRMLGLLLLVGVAILLPARPASAAVPTTASPTWQTNATVWVTTYARGAFYLAGDFTKVRPPGAALGVNEVTRTYMAAFSASTGGLLAFKHTFNARPSAIARSPDGSKLYVGGAFTTVDGKTRSRLAAFDTATGALTSWAPRASASVKALAVSPDGSKIYVGGNFGYLNGVGRTRLGAVNSAGTLDPNWKPTADATVYAMAVAPDGSRVFIGGYFSYVNGQYRRATASLYATSGANAPWASYKEVPAKSSTCSSNIKTVAVDTSKVYFGAEGTGGGCFDGTFAARQSDGVKVWRDNCLGATQAVVVIGAWLYIGSHAHNCSTVPGGFGETSPPHHLMRESTADGHIDSSWFPNTNGKPLGPRALATDGARLAVGGDFTSVNSKPQQGFTKFG